jgi:hypothetical protein
MYHVNFDALHLTLTSTVYFTMGLASMKYGNKWLFRSLPVLVLTRELRDTQNTLGFDFGFGSELLHKSRDSFPAFLYVTLSSLVCTSLSVLRGLEHVSAFCALYPYRCLLHQEKPHLLI